MKKSVIFLILVAFVMSIFLLSSYGTAAESSQLKTYFSSVSILTYDFGPEDGMSTKILYVDYIVVDSDPYIYLDYTTTPNQEDVSESDAVEFVFPANFKEDESVDIESMSQEEYEAYVEEKNTFYANGVKKAYLYKNTVTFFGECVVNVMLRTTDGSTLYDQVMIICSIPATE